MDWEEDREEYIESGKFKTPDEISRRILERAEARSSVAILYFCLLLFGVGILSLLLYFLV